MAIKKGTALVTAADRKFLKKFGHRVCELRIRKNLTVYDVTGDDMPIRSRQHWQKIESGQKNINLTTAAKIAKSLGVPLQALVDGLDT